MLGFHCLGAYFLVILFSVSCGALFGPQTSGDGTTKITGGEDGSLSAIYNKDKELDLNAPQDSEISGASLSIPAGSLSVSTQVTLGAAASLESLAASEFTDIVAAEVGGASVSFSADDSSATILSPMTLSLPVSAASGLAETKLTVFYQIQTTGGASLGFIDSEDFKSTTSKTVTVEISNFGVFQVLRVNSSVNVKAIAPKKDSGVSGLQGTWLSNCHVVDDADGAEADKNTSNADVPYAFGYAVSRVSFIANRVNFARRFFSKEGCGESDQVQSVRVVGQFVTREASDGSVDYREIDLLVSASYLTPKSILYVRDLNRSKLCGYSDWALNKERFIGKCSESVLNDFPVSGQKILDIYGISGSKLSFGLESESSDTTRPSLLETDLDKVLILQPAGVVGE